MKRSAPLLCAAILGLLFPVVADAASFSITGFMQLWRDPGHLVTAVGGDDVARFSSSVEHRGFKFVPTRATIGSSALWFNPLAWRHSS